MGACVHELVVTNSTNIFEAMNETNIQQARHWAQNVTELL
jgi:hypothetical protein